MKYTFNELSLADGLNGITAESDLIQFATICSELFSKGFRLIKFANRAEFLMQKLNGGLTIAECLKTIPFEDKKSKLLIQKLKGIVAASSKIWDDELQKMIDSCPLVYIDHQAIQITPQGLKIACILDTFCVSLACNGIWDRSIVNALWLEESDQGETFEQHVCIKHASNTLHIKNHEKWISILVKKKKLFSDWVPSKEYFPNLEHSNSLVSDGDWNQYHKEFNAAKGKDEKRSVIFKYAYEVAERNNYIYNQIISDLNTSSKHKRVIFHAGKGKNRIFLSIDIEKGGFEVCGYDGCHLGEYFFDGRKTKNADANHSIILT